MENTFGLSKITVDELLNYFKTKPEIKLVKIYGSRAKGTFHNGSDIDFAIWTDENTDISTLVREIKNEEQINNPNCVKCVFDNNYNALYFSRCPIPFARNKEKSPYYAHIGIYGYKKESLIKMTQLPQSNLEKQESLEQLRALQNGMKIKVAITTLNPTGIDTIEDYEKFKKLMEN